MSFGVGDDGSDVFRFEMLRGKKKKKKKKKKQSCVLDRSAKRKKKKKKKRRRRGRAVFWTKVLRGKIVC